MPTLHELVAAGRRRLYDAGIPQAEADLDARLMLEHLLQWDAAHFFGHGEQLADAELTQRYDACIERRARREPTAYVTGEREFWGLAFEVTPAVLIPRPETELIIEIALALWPDVGAPLRVADVCTGSGCLAVAIAVERPAAQVVASDVSPGALDVAARNAARHAVQPRVTFRHADVLAGIDGPFDLIVSNPPYVPTGDEPAMQPEVVRHEPRIALFAGTDGLDVIRVLLPQAAARLRPGGSLAFEFGYGQQDAVRGLISATPGLYVDEIRNDLQGIPRTALARRRGV